MIEIETEPAHSVVDDSRRDLVLCVWAIADYVKYKCTTQEIHFTDTLLYQTRVYNLPLTNSGQTTLSYKWALVHIDGSPLAPFSSQMGTEGTEAGQSEVVPFSIEPSSGQIPPGEEAVFRVCFSPLDVRDWEYKLLCRYMVYFHEKICKLLSPAVGPSIICITLEVYVHRLLLSFSPSISQHSSLGQLQYTTRSGPAWKGADALLPL